MGGMRFAGPVISVFELDNLLMRHEDAKRFRKWPTLSTWSRFLTLLYQFALGSFGICCVSYFPSGHILWMSIAFLSGSFKYAWILWVGWHLSWSKQPSRYKYASL